MRKSYPRYYINKDAKSKDYICHKVVKAGKIFICYDAYYLQSYWKNEKRIKECKCFYHVLPEELALIKGCCP